DRSTILSLPCFGGYPVMSPEASAAKGVATKKPRNLPEKSAMASAPSDESSPKPAGDAKGATILGDYKLLKKLGQGGMGAVYKALKISDNQIVAVKVLAKDLSTKNAS